MLPLSLPPSVTCLLDRFRGCFTTPTFTTFCGLACGCWAQPGLHTVTGHARRRPPAAGWHHSRAHRFFSHARWSADQLGLCLLDLILALLVADGAPVRLVVDDTLMRRSGRKVFGAAWHHDPLAPGRHRVAWANNWVVVGVLVDLPMLPHRPVCLPILARLWQPGRTPGRLDLAVELVRVVCGHLGPRRIDLVCDGAYAGKALRSLPKQVTVATRLRADACLHRLPPPRRPGTRGPPCSAPDRSRWRWCAIPTRPTGSTWPWSPPTLPPRRSSWSSATPPAGRWRSCSKRAGRSPGSARPATTPPVPWSAPSPSACCA